MMRIVLLGSGNVARHLFEVIQSIENFKIVQVVSRNAESLVYFEASTEVTTDFDALAEAEIYLLAVSDDAIAELAVRINRPKALVLHTSGSIPLQHLPKTSRRGVFYPLQTFSRDIEVDFRNIPICLEAENETDYKILEDLAHKISGSVYRVDSDQRQQLHIAAVFVNNFVNHLLYIGQEICQEQQLSFEILQPLIRETIRKAAEISPYDAQTGPARRNDGNILQQHREQISDPRFQDIYSTISKSIMATYGEKL